MNNNKKIYFQLGNIESGNVTKFGSYLDTIFKVLGLKGQNQELSVDFQC